MDEYGETVYDMDFTSGDTTGIREALIMDFSLANGDAFPSDCFHNTEYMKEGLFKADLEPVVYFDRSYEKYGICNAGGNEFSPRYAEVLGGLNNGIFPDNTLYVAPNMTSEYLLTVTEPDGGTIYRSPSYEWLLNPDFSDRPRLIREDRVWEYVYSEGINLPTFDVKGEVGRQIFRMRFDGTEEHDGHVYHRLKYTGDLTRVVYAPAPSGDILECVYSEEMPNDNDMVYLMREDDGRVYLLNKGIGNLSEIYPDGVDEIMVYDFNKSAGESYRFDYGVQYWNCERIWYSDAENGYCNIVSTETVCVDGDECIKQNIAVMFEESSIVEGIGFVQHGTLPFFYVDIRTGLEWVDCDLNRVYDSVGNVIFEGECFDAPMVGIGSVSEDASPRIKYDGKALQVKSPDGTGISLSLLDISGTLMSRVSGNGSVSASTAALSPGVYVAVAEADGATVARRKFVVR